MTKIQTIHKKDWILFVLFAILLVTARLPSFSEPLENDSGVNAFFARQMLRGETLYDAFHPGHHLPGIYYTVALAFRMFGDNSNSPKLLLLPWTLACALLLYLLGRRCFDEQIGIAAALFFILVSSQRGLAGMTVEMEHFANLPLIGGIFLLLVLYRQQAASPRFFWIGLLGALSMLYKVIFVAPLVAAGISILLLAWMTRKELGAWKTMFARLIWMAIGFMVPLAVVGVYFASLGLWKRLMLVFSFGFNYFDYAGLMNSSSLPTPFGFPLFWMSVNNIALLIFGLIGISYLAWRSIPIKSIDHLEDLILILWLVVSLAMAGLRGGGYPHYLLPVVPPLALMASIGIGITYQRWKMSAERLANLGRSAAIALVLFLFLWSNYSLYRDYTMYKLARISYDRFLQNVYGEGFSSQQISKYIQARTKPDDFIYLWSLHTDIYYSADRRPPVDMLWTYYVGRAIAPDQIFNPRTKYIVADIPKNSKLPQWLIDGLNANYELESVIAGSEVYRRIQ